MEFMIGGLPPAPDMVHRSSCPSPASTAFTAREMPIGPPEARPANQLSVAWATRATASSAAIRFTAAAVSEIARVRLIVRRMAAVLRRDDDIEILLTHQSAHG